MEHSEAFQDFLLNDVLQRDRLDIPKGHQIDLTRQFPGSDHLSLRNGGGIGNVETIAHDKHDMVLITIPADSKYLTKLGSWPLERHHEIENRLAGECSLTRGDDYMFMAVHSKINGGRTISPNPSEYMLTMTQPAFHDLAMEMLRELADSRKGAELVGADVSFYELQFRSDTSKVSQMLEKIVGHAKLAEKDWAELKGIAASSDNFEFIMRLAALPNAPRGVFARPTQSPGSQQGGGRGVS